MTLPYLTQLTADDLQQFGIDGFSYGQADRVRFHELDSLNHVNNAVYASWFETLRVAYLQDYKLTNYSGTDADPMLVVRAQSLDYLKPVFQNEDYVMATRTVVLKPSSFIMDYALFCNTELRATGRTVMVSLEQDGKTRRTHKAEAIETIQALDAPEMVGF